MGYDASAIKVLPGLEAVRKRPRMYFGCEAEDPAFAGRVMELMVADALVDPRDDPPAQQPRRVKVTVVHDRRFRIEDDEPAWVMTARDQSVDALMVRALTVLNTGWSRWGAGVATGVAVCSEVIAELRVDGRRYRQTITMTEQPEPAEDLGPADDTGPLVDFRLDDTYLPSGAALPADPAGALFHLLEYDPPNSPYITRPAPRPGTRLEVRDLRTGITSVACRDH